MGTVVDFRQSPGERPRMARRASSPECEVVIFPGVRIERHAVDLGYRVRESAGRDDFNGLGGKRRPRKSS